MISQKFPVECIIVDAAKFIREWLNCFVGKIIVQSLYETNTNYMLNELKDDNSKIFLHSTKYKVFSETISDISKFKI